ncbi:MAG: hypothetical protein OHK0022_12160 [Roseiflexaceae bacterium]
MFPPKRTKRTSPLQKWYAPAPAPQQLDFILLATDLMFLSMRKGAWKSLRIGAIYGGKFGFVLGVWWHASVPPFVVFQPS